VHMGQRRARWSMSERQAGQGAFGSGSTARDHGLHRSWIYKLLARYQREARPDLALARDDRTVHRRP
jgi:hypothetical protein